LPLKVVSDSEWDDIFLCWLGVSRGTQTGEVKCPPPLPQDRIILVLTNIKAWGGLRGRRVANANVARTREWYCNKVYCLGREGARPNLHNERAPFH
jgi:hypothetical protein